MPSVEGLGLLSLALTGELPLTITHLGVVLKGLKGCGSSQGEW